MKRAFVVSVLILTSVVIFSAAKFDIRYGGQYYPEEFLLKGYDFFSEVGISVDHFIFSSGTENNLALISGNIDVSVASDSKSVALFNSMGDQVLIIGVAQRGDRYSTIVRADSKYESWYDLKGKKIGTRFGTGADFVLKKFFESVPGLSWDDFQWINISPEDMIATLASGQIDAFTVWAPTGDICVAQGIGRSIRSYGDIAMTPVLIHTSKKFADTNRNLLVRFIAAHLKKAELIKTNPQLAAEYAANAAKSMGISITSDAFLLIFERIDFSLDFDETIINELRSTAEFLYSEGSISKVPEFYYDTSFINEAKELLKSEE